MSNSIDMVLVRGRKKSLYIASLFAKLHRTSNRAIANGLLEGRREKDFITGKKMTAERLQCDANGLLIKTIRGGMIPL